MVHASIALTSIPIYSFMAFVVCARLEAFGMAEISISCQLPPHRLFHTSWVTV